MVIARLQQCGLAFASVLCGGSPVGVALAGSHTRGRGHRLGRRVDARRCGHHRHRAGRDASALAGSGPRGLGRAPRSTRRLPHRLEPGAALSSPWPRPNVRWNCWSDRHQVVCLTASAYCIATPASHALRSSTSCVGSYLTSSYHRLKLPRSAVVCMLLSALS
jgi:hypothetical protein